MMLAPNLGVKNFVVMLDNNKQLLDGYTNTINGLGDMQKKAEDFGWFAVSCDGHVWKRLITRLTPARRPINPVLSF